jgi:hypothetical protein
MANSRGDTPDGERERDIRQQKLPLSWQAAAAAGAQPLTAAPAAAAAATLPQAEPEAPAGLAAAASADGSPAEAKKPAAVPAPAAAAAVGVDSAATARGPQVTSRPAAAGLGDSEPAAAAAALGSVGDLLLSARADSGFSIEEASARTRIPRDIIEHLECSACGQLPSEYYCNAHVEKLSVLYNVDPKPILDRLHEDMLAHRGAAEGIGHFHAVMTDSESGAKISYVPPGPGSGKPTRAVSLTGAVVSGVIALFLLVAVVALAAQHFRHREGATPSGSVPPQVGHAAAVELKEFIVTQPLNAYELPIPAK